MEEEWRDAIGFEGYYQVSESGLVRGNERHIPIKDCQGNCNVRIIHAKTLTKRINNGYVTYKLSINSDGRYYSASRLVGFAFIPNPDNYPEINHIDGNKLNNHKSNLEWCTRQQNVKHAFDNNLNHGFTGVDHSKCRFTEDEVRDIRKMWDNGIKSNEISIKYGCSKSAIEHIGRRRLWKHLL